MTTDQRFRPRERLRLRADFTRVFYERRSASDDRLVVYMAGNGLAWSRLGISTGKKIGGAVARNYARRRIREAFRTSKSDIPGGYDIVVVTKRDLRERRYDVVAALLTLIRRALQRKPRTPIG